jgi:hypothetical protein
MATTPTPVILPTDPISAALSVLNTLIVFGEMVYNDTPLPIRQENAADWGNFLHNINTQILKLQNKINGVS